MAAETPVKVKARPDELSYMEERVSLWTRCKARNWEIHPCGGEERGHSSAVDEGKSRQSR